MSDNLLQQIAVLKEENIELYRQLNILKAEVQGPKGFDTWNDAALSERIKRIDAENKLVQLQKGFVFK